MEKIGVVEMEPKWSETCLKAIAFATLKHEGQKRMGGAPYVTHPIAVAKILFEKGFGEPYLLAGFFHDLLEDTDAKESEIVVHGGQEPQRVLEVVRRLTKRKGYQMVVYIKEISEDFIAKMVKLADRLHNLRTALDANLKFQKRYIEETQTYYIDLAKGTVFEQDITDALEHLIAHVQQVDTDAIH